MICLVSSRPKYRKEPFFIFFRCSNDFIMQKSVFLTVNASLRWLNNVSGVYLVQVSCLLMGQRGLGHLFTHL
jgi:hypothetical protein